MSFINMEMVKLLVGVSILIGTVVLIIHLLKVVTKAVGYKAIYISIIFVVPIAMGLTVVALNFDDLKWYEVIYIPFAGSAFILAMTLLVAVQLNPEVLCIPFKYVWKRFNNKYRN